MRVSVEPSVHPVQRHVPGFKLQRRALKRDRMPSQKLVKRLLVQ